MEMGSQSCELCANPGGAVLWQNERLRVVRVDDPHYPGFCRVIWQGHVKEMTDLDAHHQMRLMRVVFAIEAVVRRLFAPDKINLASFGNMVPHLHWHIIPRWRDDRHFPEPIWGVVHSQDHHRRNLVSDHELSMAVHAELSRVEA